MGSVYNADVRPTSPNITHKGNDSRYTLSNEELAILSQNARIAKKAKQIQLGKNIMKLAQSKTVPLTPPPLPTGPRPAVPKSPVSNSPVPVEGARRKTRRTRKNKTRKTRSNRRQRR